MSAGSRSGVNWMRRNVRANAAATALTASVLASPGTPSTRTWPSVRSPMRRPSIRRAWPTMIFPTSFLSGSKQRLAGSVSTGCVRSLDDDHELVGLEFIQVDQAHGRRRPILVELIVRARHEHLGHQRDLLDLLEAKVGGADGDRRLLGDVEGEDVGLCERQELETTVDHLHLLKLLLVAERVPHGVLSGQGGFPL